MANGYGTLSSSSMQRRTNAQGQVAPRGFHFMPDGSLMSDAEHEAIYSEKHSVKDREKTINFILDTSNIPQDGGVRKFTIKGNKDAMFSLEVTNEDSPKKYYNFNTREFTTTKYKLEATLRSSPFTGSIHFPAVTDADQYDIKLFAEGNNTKHAIYNEVRFEDDTIDINSSTGSNSLLVEKVIYQLLDFSASLTAISPNSVTAFGGMSTVAHAISTMLPGTIKSMPFKITVTSGTGKAFKLLRQPTQEDIGAFVQRTIGSAPVLLPGENEYPTARAAFTGDDVNGAVTSGSVVRMDNTDLSAAIEVGDKITASTSTDTVDGAVSSSNRIVMDNNVATKMAVGDQVTGTGIAGTSIVTVTHLDPDTDNAKELQVSEAVSISDGVTLTFSPKVNRRHTTVTVVETSGTATDFTMSQAIQFRDNQPLTFTPRKNYSWPIDNSDGLAAGALPSGTNVVSGTKIGSYEKTETIPGKVSEEIVVERIKPIEELGVKPTITRNATTNIVTKTQTGNVTFNQQQPLILAGDTLKFYTYGTKNVKALTGVDLSIRDLKAVIIEPTTTTSSAVQMSTSVPVTSGDGIMDDVSTVTGDGVRGKPLVTTIGSYSGTTATLTLSTPQTLESGAKLKFHGAGETLVITGLLNAIFPEQPTADWDNNRFAFNIENFVTATVET